MLVAHGLEQLGSQLIPLWKIILKNGTIKCLLQVTFSSTDFPDIQETIPQELVSIPETNRSCTLGLTQGKQYYGLHNAAY